MLAPVADPTVPFWHSERDEWSTHRTTEDLPAKAEIVVIGAGFSGASTAFHLFKDAKGDRPDVLILEARDACSGATGRNGGHMRPDVYGSWAHQEKTFGVETAGALARFELKGFADARRLVAEEKIDCELEITRSCDVFLEQTVKDTVVDAYKAMAASGYVDIADFEVYETPEETEAATRVKGALGAVVFTSGYVWPYKLVMHLLRRAVAMGANLQTNTAATKLERQHDGSWIVRTSRGDIIASKVVLASNAYTAGLLPEFKDKITPVKGVACHIEAAPESQTKFLTNTYAIRYGPGTYDYLIARKDGSIVVGGAKQVYLKENDLWHGNISDDTLFPGAQAYFESYMQRTFHGWENSDAVIKSIWTGIMGYAADNSPFVGPVPGKPGLYICGGFTGHGMPLILGCGRAVAQLLNGDIRSIEESELPWPFWLTEARMQGAQDRPQGGMTALEAGASFARTRPTGNH